MGIPALAVEKRSAELVLQLLDCAGQCGLADVALLGGAREIQRACKGNEVAHLLHFHGRVPRSSGGEYLYRRNETR